MENYKVEVVKSEKHADSTGRTVVRVSAKNEKDMLTLPDVKEIVKELNQKTTKDYVIIYQTSMYQSRKLECMVIQMMI